MQNPVADSSFGLWIENNTRLGLSLAVAGVVLCASAYLAPRASLTEVLEVGALLAVLAGAIAVLRWPALGPIGLVVASVLVPLEIGTGTESSVNAALLGVVGTAGLWVLDMVAREDARIDRPRLFLSLAALGAVATLAMAFGYQPEIPFAQTAPLRAQLGGTAIFWLSPLAFLVVGHQLRSARWLEALTWTFIGLGGIYLLARLAHLDFVIRRYPDGLTNGSLFYLWLAVLAFGQAAFNRRLNLGVRSGCAVIAAGVLYLGFFTNRDWSSGWVPPLVALGVALWIARPRLGTPIALAAAALLALSWSSVSSLLLNDYKQYDILTRQAAWTTLLPLVKVNPILGLGPANYYWYAPLFTILGWNVRFNSHEQYMDLVLQTGFLGLLVFFWVVGEIASLGWRLRHRVAVGFEQAYVYGALGGLVGTLFAGLLGDWFLPFVYNVGFNGFRASVLGWIFLGGLLVLDRQSRVSKRFGWQKRRNDAPSNP